MLFKIVQLCFNVEQVEHPFFFRTDNCSEGAGIGYGKGCAACTLLVGMEGMEGMEMEGRFIRIGSWDGSVPCKLTDKNTRKIGNI